MISVLGDIEVIYHDPNGWQVYHSQFFTIYLEPVSLYIWFGGGPMFTLIGPFRIAQSFPILISGIPHDRGSLWMICGTKPRLLMLRVDEDLYTEKCTTDTCSMYSCVNDGGLWWPVARRWSGSPEYIDDVMARERAVWDILTADGTDETVRCLG